MNVHIYMVVLLIIVQKSSAIETDTKMEVIKDIIKDINKPVVSIGYFCKTKESIAFVRTMSTNGIMSKTSKFNTDPVPHAFPINVAVFVVDLKCDNVSTVLNKANTANLFLSPNHWIFIDTNNKNYLHYFNDTDILVDSEVMVAKIVSEYSSTVHYIYKTGKNTSIIIENAGVWNKTEGYVNLLQDKVTANRRKNLMGSILKSCLVITHNGSLKHLTDKRDKHIDTIAKVNYVFMLHLADMFDATMVYSIQNSWGYQNKSGEWSGMIGELTRKEADIGGTPLFLTTDRVAVVDYIAMTTPTKSKFVFRQPKLSYITNVFTLPFDDLVWIYSIVMVTVTALALYVVTKWEKRKKDIVIVTNVSNGVAIQDSLMDVFFLAFSAVCQQGSHVIPYTVAGRIITIVLFVSLMFLYTSYSANIVALLQSSSTSIQTLNDLLHSRLQVGVDDTVFNHFYFPNATEPIRKAIYEQKVAPPGQSPRFFSIEEGVSKLRKGLFAFHMETGAGYKIVAETFLEDEKCGLQEIQYLQVPDPWLAIQKNSSYKEMLKIGLRKIHESGLQPREVSLLYTKMPECTSRGSSFVGVSIVDCYPAAMVFAFGIGASFVIFILELLIRFRGYLFEYVVIWTREPLPYVE